MFIIFKSITNIHQKNIISKSIYDMEIKNFDIFISENYNLVLENMYEYIQKINQKKKITITCNLFFCFIVVLRIVLYFFHKI